MAAAQSSPKLEPNTPSAGPDHTRLIGGLAGAFVAIAILIFDIPRPLAVDGLAVSAACVVLACLVLMAVWWVSEAIPIPVTSLLPLIVFPLFGVASVGQTAAPYMHPIVVLLLGGFIFAKAIEHWGLHERIALTVVARAGTEPRALIAGFMIAAAALSMWISNTATAIMMMPIALSVASAISLGDAKANRAFMLALLLGIAYACSIGGLGTPIGTPTNLIVMGYLNDNAGFDIGFEQWVGFGLPAVVLLLPAAWFVLTRWSFTIGAAAQNDARTVVRDRLAALGPISTPQARVMTVFVIIASLWMFRRPLNGVEFTLFNQSLTPFAGLKDQVTAILAVLLCFLIPAGGDTKPGTRLLDWSVGERIPWGVVLLFGGGMSLATAITSSGLGAFLGDAIGSQINLPLPIVLLILTLCVLALTEITSNVATASAIMPVLGAVALEAGLPLETVAAPVALAASCAFMLPMATGPNAVVYATGQVSLRDMARAGVRLNLLAAIFIVTIAYTLAPRILG